MKPQKYGIKIYLLCEAKSGYCIAHEVYDGVKTNEEVGEKTYNLVHRLLRTSDLLGKGYEVYTDR